MKKTTIIAMGLIMMVLVAAGIPTKENMSNTESSINFQKISWNDALVMAKEQNKPIFLELSASWCGYCKKMKADVYTESGVADYYNSNFINVMVDGDTPEGKELANKYHVKGYPSFVFVSPEGSVIKQSAGLQTADNFLKLAKNVSSNE